MKATQNLKEKLAALTRSHFFNFRTLKKACLLVSAGFLVEYAIVVFAYRISPAYPNEWPSFQQLYEETYLILMAKALNAALFLAMLHFVVRRPKFRARIGDFLAISGGTLEYILASANLIGDKGVCIVDSSRKILLCNTQVRGLLGLSSEHVIGRYVRDVFPQHLVTHVEYIERMAIATRKPQALELTDAPTASLQDAYGALRITAIPVHYPKGDLAGLIILTENISSIKQTEQDNFTALSHYRRLISYLPVGVLLCEGWIAENGRPAFKVLESNSAANAIYGDGSLGVSPSADKFTAYFNQDSILMAGLSRIISKGEPFKYEYYHPYLGKTLSCLFAGIDVNKFIWLTYDVTDKNSTETQVLQLNDNLRRLKRMHHGRLTRLLNDTNMVMVTIADELQPHLDALLALKKDLPASKQAEVRGALDAMHCSLEKMLKFVNFSQIPLGKELLDLNLVAKTVIDKFTYWTPRVRFEVDPLPRLITSPALCQSFFTCTITALLPFSKENCIIKFAFDSKPLQPIIYIGARGVDVIGLLLLAPPSDWALLDWAYTSNLEMAQARRLSKMSGGTLMIRQRGGELQIGYNANLGTAG